MRLIDADALKKAIIKHLCVKSAKYLLPAEKSIYDLIDKQPTIELLKEQQRSWKPDNVKGNYICGRCGNPLHTAMIDPMIQYCDHCGHKVDWTRGEQE